MTTHHELPHAGFAKDGAGDSSRRHTAISDELIAGQLEKIEL